VFVVIREDDGDGPAVSVDVKNTGCRKTAFSVDLVPAVCLMEWPDPAKNWTSSWLSSDDISAIKTPEYHDAVKPFVVAKIHPTGRQAYTHSVYSA